MPDLLHVTSSPRRDRSESLALAEALLDAYRKTAPEAEIDRHPARPRLRFRPRARL